MKNKKTSEYENMKGGGDYDIYTGQNRTIRLYTQSGFGGFRGDYLYEVNNPDNYKYISAITELKDLAGGKLITKIKNLAIGDTKTTEKLIKEPDIQAILIQEAKQLLGEDIEPETQEPLTEPQTSPPESHIPTRMNTERRQQPKPKQKPRPPPGPPPGPPPKRAPVVSSSDTVFNGRLSGENNRIPETSSTRPHTTDFNGSVSASSEEADNVSIKHENYFPFLDKDAIDLEILKQLKELPEIHDNNIINQIEIELQDDLNQSLNYDNSPTREATILFIDVNNIYDYLTITEKHTNSVLKRIYDDYILFLDEQTKHYRDEQYRGGKKRIKKQIRKIYTGQKGGKYYIKNGQKRYL